MNAITSQSWFWWAVAVVVGLPIVLVALTEVEANLTRRGSAMARPVALLRNYILPSGALILLLTKASGVSTEATWVRIVTTFFGVMLMMLVLAGLNVALFSNAAQGSWRDRMPSIFVDIFRLMLIITGVAVIFAYVWGADVGGLFTALGVTSVVLGFALQNAVGSIVSGLLLLFEQPFKLGDWLDTGSVRGRIVEVNWRAVHIEVGNGVQIVPNASLAGSSFTNLSRPTDDHIEEVTSTFALEDPPGEVIRLLEQVATDLPMAHPTIPPTCSMTGPKTYVTAIPVTSSSLGSAANATFQRWVWYAARRAGLRLDGLVDDYSSQERLEASLSSIASILHLEEGDVPALAASAQLLRFGHGETVQPPGVIPTAMTFVMEGTVALRVPMSGGGLLKIGDLQSSDYLGQTALTREQSIAGGYAEGDVVALRVPRDTLDQLVRARPNLAADIGRTIERRRTRALEAMASVSAPDPIRR